jgi:NAD(P)-dependent dehydrogenase (short-subunit alcohol dehydrogenase family)
VSSGASRHGGGNVYVDYAASKGAVDVLTLGLSKEVGPEGIRVNCVRPGIIYTEIHASGGDPTASTSWRPPCRSGAVASRKKSPKRFCGC